MYIFYKYIYELHVSVATIYKQNMYMYNLFCKNTYTHVNTYT